MAILPLELYRPILSNVTYADLLACTLASKVVNFEAETLLYRTIGYRAFNLTARRLDCLLEQLCRSPTRARMVFHLDYPFYTHDKEEIIIARMSIALPMMTRLQTLNIPSLLCDNFRLLKECKFQLRTFYAPPTCSSKCLTEFLVSQPRLENLILHTRVIGLHGEGSIGDEGAEEKEVPEGPLSTSKLTLSHESLPNLSKLAIHSHATDLLPILRSPLVGLNWSSDIRRLPDIYIPTLEVLRAHFEYVTGLPEFEDLSPLAVRFPNLRFLHCSADWLPTNIEALTAGLQHLHTLRIDAGWPYWQSAEWSNKDFFVENMFSEHTSLQVVEAQVLNGWMEWRRGAKKKREIWSVVPWDRWMEGL